MSERLQGRIDALDGHGGGRVFVEGPPGRFLHFSAADWHAGGRPLVGLQVLVTAARGGTARAVTPLRIR